MFLIKLKYLVRYKKNKFSMQKEYLFINKGYGCNLEITIGGDKVKT